MRPRASQQENNGLKRPCRLLPMTGRCDGVLVALWQKPQAMQVRSSKMQLRIPPFAEDDARPVGMRPLRREAVDSVAVYVQPNRMRRPYGTRSIYVLPSPR